MSPKRPAWTGALPARFIWTGVPAFAQDATGKFRGDRDKRYGDEHGDLPAGAPHDGRRLKDPGTPLFTHSPLADPAVLTRLMQPFAGHPATGVGRRKTVIGTASKR